MGIFFLMPAGALSFMDEEEGGSSWQRRRMLAFSWEKRRVGSC